MSVKYIITKIFVLIGAFAGVCLSQSVFPPNGGGSSSVGNCQSASSTPGNCYPYSQTITQSSGTLTAALGSATIDNIYITTLSANVTNFTITGATNGEEVNIYDCSGGTYTIASPSGWPTIPVHPLTGACVLTKYLYYNSSNIFIQNPTPQGTAPGVCFAQSDPGSNPPSSDFYTGCDSNGLFSLNSSGTYGRMVAPTTCTAPSVVVAVASSGAVTCSTIGLPENSQSTAYTTVIGDAGGQILHPTSDNNARTFTIAANASVAYLIGTTITFVNLENTVTIAINSDTLILAGPGTTGSRTLAANGIATALKVSSTTWIISGSGLT